LNYELLELYSNCTDAADVVEKQNMWLAINETHTTIRSHIYDVSMVVQDGNDSNAATSSSLSSLPLSMENTYLVDDLPPPPLDEYDDNYNDESESEPEMDKFGNYI
jgi:hypothetical protein